MKSHQHQQDAMVDKSIEGIFLTCVINILFMNRIFLVGDWEYGCCNSDECFHEVKI